jgi:bifunctional non-homologous end joining protein LigD
MAAVTVPTPALATLSHERFFSKGWIYERKLDGERCLATRHDGRVRLHSRSGRDVTHSFPEIVEALESQDSPDFVVDGEVVAFKGSQTSFAALQPRINLGNADKARATRIPVFYYVFDLLSLDAHDTRGLPLLERKSLLKDLFDYTGPLRFTVHRRNADESTFADACARGWEGLIAKRADARYPSGRSRDWLKFKCESGQEFVIGGYTDPQGSRTGFGALLLGYYRNGDLVYAGKVGTGFDHATLTSIHAELRKRARDTSPFDVGNPPTNGVHWVEPTLVCQVAFSEWTGAGQLRHPRFQGLRRDKDAADVVRE